MTVTFLGNSLTAGNLGISYLRLLQKTRPETLVNRGRDGDTVLGIRSRLDDALRADVSDVVVLQTGANDILLPRMANRGAQWRSFVQSLVDQGALPSPNLDEFQRNLSEVLDRIDLWSPQKTVLCTIPLLGEDLSSDLNQIRMVFNESIRSLASQSVPGLILADVGARFDELLGQIDLPSSWFFENLSDFVSDRRRIHKDRSAEPLSEERGLHYTMDGAHLNERGAAVMAEVLTQALD